MRLEKYIAVRPTTAMMAVIVQIMVEVISILGITTKEIKEGRISRSFLVDIFVNLTFYAEKFSKRLFGINRLSDASQRLDKLTQEEALLAEAETLVIAARIEVNVIHVGENVEVINEEVQGIRVTVEGTHIDVQSIQREVSSIYTGDLPSSLATEGCPQPYSIRCNGDQRRDTGGTQVCWRPKPFVISKLHVTKG